MHLQFKFEVSKKNQWNEKKLMKYTKKSLNIPKFEQEVWNNVGTHKKKIREKNKKQKKFPECLSWLSGKGLFPECKTHSTRGSHHFPLVPSFSTREKGAFPESF